MTGRARVLQLPFAAAARARKIELHGARHLRNRAGAVALRAGDTTARGRARPISLPPPVGGGYCPFGPAPGGGLPKIDFGAFIKIGTPPRFPPPPPPPRGGRPAKRSPQPPPPRQWWSTAAAARVPRL